MRSEFIFDRARFPSSHASTIVETRSHRLVVAWFGGTHEGASDVVIYASSFEKSAWTAPTEIAHGEDSRGRPLPCYNPVLFQPKLGPLMLFFKVGTSPQTWWGMVATSTDDGKTWSKGVRLPATILGPIKNKPIELENGTLLCPSSTEDTGWKVHFETTKDGRSWHRSDDSLNADGIGAIQPAILRLGGSHLRALGRTQQRRIFTTDSIDNGQTWSPVQLTPLANPNSGIDAVTLRDGRHVLVLQSVRNQPQSAGRRRFK